MGHYGSEMEGDDSRGMVTVKSRVPNVVEQFDRLEARLENMTNVIDKLHQRLSGVLLPESSEKPSLAEDSPEMSEVARRLNNMGDQVLIQVRNLEDLLSRVDI